MSLDFDFEDGSVLKELDDIISVTSVAPHLDCDQKSAVLADPSVPLMIVAAAGSGKTTVMTHRMQFFIHSHSIKPENILAVTFSVRASRELTKRTMQNPLMKGINIGTFHSICLRILYAHTAQLPLKPNFTIVQKRAVLECVGKVLADRQRGTGRRLGGSAGGGQLAGGNDDRGKSDDGKSVQREDIEQLISWIERQKTKDLPPSAFADGVEKTAYLKYQEFLKESNSIDFVDMVGMIVALFKTKPAVCDAYRSRFTHVLVDEFQDTSMLQWQFLKLIMGNSVTVVGDDDQSIYAFRGASASRIFGEFRENYGAVRVVTLNTNYRSTRTIVQAASAVILRNGFREPKTIKAQESVANGAKIAFSAVGTVDAEVDAVANYIVRNKIRPGHCAILCRVRKNILPLFAKAFRRKGIACTYNLPSNAIGSGRPTNEHTILTSDVVAYLEAIANPKNNDAFTRVLQKPKRGVGPSMFDYLDALRGLAASAARNCAEYALDDYHSLAVFAVAKDFPAPGKHSHGRRPSRAAREGVSSFLAWLCSMQKRSEHCRVSELCEMIMRDVQYDAEEDWEREDANLSDGLTILDIIRQVEESEFDSLVTLEDPCLRLRFVLDNIVLWEPEDSVSLMASDFTTQSQSQSAGKRKIDESDHLPPITIDAVTLTTIHQSKGLEWPYVFVVRCNEGTMPVQPPSDARSLEQAEHLEEERRIAYVGFTRAMRELHISACISDDRSKISRFVWDVPADMMTIVSGQSAETLKRNAYKALFGDKPVVEASVSIRGPHTPQPQSTASARKTRENPLLASQFVASANPSLVDAETVRDTPPAKLFRI
eukprot:ANDGO_01632.mRNA.1 ATP-dependent DNA helicase PcrA